MRVLGALLLCQLSVAAAPEMLEVEGGKFALTLPFKFTRGDQTDDQLRASWDAQAGNSVVYMELRVFPVRTYALQEPEEVTLFVGETYADPKQEGDPGFAFDTVDLLEGAYGCVPYAAYARGLLPNANQPRGEAYVLGGRIQGYAYSLVLEAKPSLGDADRAKVLSFVKEGVHVDSELRDPNWTDAEVRHRWGGVPRKVYRTKHYIVFTNSGAGKLFARKMEDCYAKIRKVFPFPEIKGRRLMPVFLYRNNEEYETFCREVAKMDREEARATKGHAWKDYYATYYDSPNDPVHIHEATHQIFANRLFLNGGGSWFQEGVAEYMCTSRSERRSHARPSAKKGGGPGLAYLVKQEQLGSAYSYLQAACIIGFLHDGRWQPEKFETFIRAVGQLPERNLPLLERTIQRIYGTDLRGFGQQWSKYWKR